MERLRNFTRFHLDLTETSNSPPTVVGAEEVSSILAYMEIIIIVIAVLAVAVAIILLALLQLRIQKQNSRENSTTRSTREQIYQTEEIAVDYPNDRILKTGPPPYRQVMKTPELYPLATSGKRGNTEVMIQIPISPKHNQRSKRNWNQLLNAVLRSEDLAANTRSGKLISSNNNTQTLKDSRASNSPVTDEALPTYDEVCLRNTPEESKVASRNVNIHLPRRDSADIVKSGQYNFLGFNFGIEKNMLCKKEGVFIISNALKTAITNEQILSTSRPRLATL